MLGISRKQHPSSKGFTLVEMAIVLVIIGLILAAVSIGKDAQRNAEYNRISQKFVGQWQQAYNEHYERYGVPVGDNPQTPTLMVGGTAGAGGEQAGATLVTAMENAGIKLPSGSGGTGAGGADKSQFVYLDHAGTPRTLTIAFRYEANASTVCNGIIGNVMLIRNLTPELAKMLDQRIDGILNPALGVFRATSGTTITGSGNTAAWQNAADAGSATESVHTGTLNACWKMTN